MPVKKNNKYYVLYYALHITGPRIIDCSSKKEATSVRKGLIKKLRMETVEYKQRLLKNGYTEKQANYVSKEWYKRSFPVIFLRGSGVIQLTKRPNPAKKY